jgi:hypothetical protein
MSKQKTSAEKASIDVLVAVSKQCISEPKKPYAIKINGHYCCLAFDEKSEYQCPHMATEVEMIARKDKKLDMTVVKFYNHCNYAPKKEVIVTTINFI